MSLVLDVDAAAVATGISASTIRRWVQQGRVQPLQRGPVVVDVSTILREHHRAKRAKLGGLLDK